MNCKHFSLLFLFLFSTQTFYADIDSMDSFVENMKMRIENAKDRTRYYGPYVLAGTVVSGSFAKSSSLGLCVLPATSLYGLYSWVSGYYEIKRIKKNYTVKTKPNNYWQAFSREKEKELFLFCRWRQQDDRYGDGYYWPTAWLMNEEQDLVKKRFIQDIHAQRIEIISNGKLTNKPRPDQVIAAITDEIEQLEQDKRELKRYTTVYLQFNQAEEVKAYNSFWRMFWPNYNMASKLYIEVVTMLKRLEILRDIVATIRSQVHGGGWPRAQSK